MKIVLTPDWFLGKDVLIEFFSFTVLFILAFLCYKNYKLDKNRKFKYLGIGFGLIALAQLATIATKIVLYYDFSFTRTIGQAIVTQHVVQSIDALYYTGFFLHRFFTLIGLYIIYKLPLKREDWENFFLALFFITIIAILSKDMIYLFHLTALLLLILITKNYYLVYEKNESQNTQILIFAFSTLAFSHVIYVFSQLSSLFVVANIIELISYITLLTLVIRILHDGKKKK
jgi:hypothetical protein